MFSDILVASQPRGLHNFISEIRASKSREEEHSRVDKELGNIRQKFAQSGNLNSYQKKKYVWKMCYIYMLGYDVDFGHVEFISLMSSTKFQEKSVGYMAVALMLKPGDELMTLVVNSIRNDIVGPYHHGQTLALSAVSNIGGDDLAEALSADVQRVILNPTSLGAQNNGILPPEVVESQRALSVKKASLCLLRLFRTNPDCLELDDWVKPIARLLEDRDVGVVLSVMSLLLGFTANSPAQFEPLVPYVISILTRMVINRTCAPDYLYYRIPCPWLQVKCLRFLQFFKIPDNAQMELLNDVLSKILVKTDVSESSNKANADHSILFEAINLVITYGADSPSFLKEHACALLGRFIGVKDANIRYLSLDAMNRMAKLEGSHSVQMHQGAVMESLRDTDISVRKRALNLAYVLTDVDNAHSIVGELVENLVVADAAIKQDMVVKIALLAEKFCGDQFEWYVNTMMRVIGAAGDFVAEAVWFRIVQVVTNHADIHEYAAEKALASVQGKWSHETIIAVAAYLLGEIGVNICEKPGMSGFDQFAALHQHFGNCSVKVQGILLTTYVKLLNLYPDQTRDLVFDVFNKYASSSQLELQQRACEYLAMPSISREVMESVLNAMPTYELSENENVLLSMQTTDGAGTDRSAFAINKSEKDASRSSYLQSKNPSAPPQKHYVYDDEPAAAPVEPKKAAAPVQDLLSMGDDDYDSSPATFDMDAIANEPTPQQIADWFKASVVAASGAKSVLFSGQFLEVSVVTEFQAQHARIAVFLRNKSSSAEISQLGIAVPTDAALTVQKQDPLSSLDPEEVAKAQLVIECMRPFADAVKLEVHYTSQYQKRTISLNLPVVPTSFFEGIPMDKATYMARWKAIEGENLEAQQIFTSAKTVDPQLISSIRTTLFPALHLSLAEGLDTDKTVTGCGSFRTGTRGADGQLAVVGAMVRLEGDPAQGKFRVTVRAKHALIAQALKNVIVTQLS